MIEANQCDQNTHTHTFFHFLRQTRRHQEIRTQAEGSLGFVSVSAFLPLLNGFLCSGASVRKKRLWRGLALDTGTRKKTATLERLIEEAGLERMVPNDKKYTKKQFQYIIYIFLEH